MAQSGSYNITTSRDGIIKRAYRICDIIGIGEDPSTSQVTEAAEALNDIVKEMAADGMPLWAIKTSSAITMVASTAAYAIGVGATVNQNAPLKILNAWLRNTTTNEDTPLLLITRQDYEALGDKTTTGEPSQLWYNPPGGIAATENAGTITLYNTPNSTAATDLRLYIVGHYPFMDFDASTDVPDFPQYWYNALKWLLADQLAYQNSLGLAERAMISKKAEFHHQQALSFGTEEGSFFIQPNYEM